MSVYDLVSDISWKFGVQKKCSLNWPLSRESSVVLLFLKFLFVFLLLISKVLGRKDFLKKSCETVCKFVSQKRF